MTKYQLGDEVEVSFIGKILEISFNNLGLPVYKIDCQDQTQLSTTAYQVKEEQIRPLLTPEMVGK